jgi:hypothetical protein
LQPEVHFYSLDINVFYTGHFIGFNELCILFLLVALVNSQVLLKGCETKGYVILSAAKAEILQRVHRPVWKDRTLVSKTTWVGSLECMQYYATVSAGENDSLDGEWKLFKVTVNCSHRVKTKHFSYLYLWHFYLLFCMDVKFGLSHIGENTD